MLSSSELNCHVLLSQRWTVIDSESNLQHSQFHAPWQGEHVTLDLILVACYDILGPVSPDTK